MKHILCFGDSNTYGYKPDRTGRYDYDVRWTGILARCLGSDYHVIEEGLNGRTTVFHDSMKPYTCGADYILPCMLSHRPLSLVIVMLGTNDCKTMFHAEADDIAKGLEFILNSIQQPQFGENGNSPTVLVMSPAAIAESHDKSEFYGEFFNRYLRVSRELAEPFQKLAQKRNCFFLDIDKVAKTSDLDGVHFDADAHKKIAQAVYQKITQEIFPKSPVLL